MAAYDGDGWVTHRPDFSLSLSLSLSLFLSSSFALLRSFRTGAVEMGRARLSKRNGKQRFWYSMEGYAADRCHVLRGGREQERGWF
jgi:hypothetical protein